jgi:hypothetical protein
MVLTLAGINSEEVVFVSALAQIICYRLCSLFTVHWSPFTVHCSLFTVHLQPISGDAKWRPWRSEGDVEMFLLRKCVEIRMVN